MSTFTAPGIPQVAARRTQSPYRRGVNHMQGRDGAVADLGMAAAAFLDAADANDVRGLYAAGMMYLKGIGVTGNAETAKAYLQTAASSGFAPARTVLDALSQGKNVSAFPIVAPESGNKANDQSGAAPGTGGVTPVRVLVIGAVVLAAAAVAGGGYWAYARKQAEAAEQLRVSEAQRKQAEEQQRSAETERQRLAAEAQAAREQAAAAVSQAEAERQKASEQQAELASQAEALRKREESLQQQAVAAAPATPVNVDDWNALLKLSTPRLRSMLEAALANSTETVVREAAAIRALPQPTRGDRKLARARNNEALAALKAEDAVRASALLTQAVVADPADEEIATNLGYALVKAGKPVEALAALQRALHLNPGRSSAWYNSALALAAQEKEQSAYAAFVLTFQFAANQQKSRDWFEKLAVEETNPTVKRLAQRLIASPAVASTTVPSTSATR